MAAAAVSGTAEEHPGDDRAIAVAARDDERVGGDAVFLVTAVAAAGWLLLFILLLVVPPSSRPRRSAGLDGGTAPMLPLPPAMQLPRVISLLTGKLDKLGFRVTLIDLAARGWFRIVYRWPGQRVTRPSRTKGPAGQGDQQDRTAHGVVTEQPRRPGDDLGSLPRKAEPVLRIDVRDTATPARRPHCGAPGWPVPGVTDGYLLGDKTVLHVGSLTVIMSIRGTVPGGNGASLIRLLPLVEARLRELAARPAQESGYGG